MKNIRQLLLISLLVCPALHAGQTRHIYPFQAKFFKAVKQNDAALVQSLIEDKNIYINMQDETDSTPLHHAVKLNITEITKILLNNGAALSIKDDAGLIPLHHAMNDYKDKKNSLRKQRIIDVYPSTEIIKLLINHSDETSINIQDNNNNTPLEKAIYPLIPIEILRLIIEAGADINIKNKVPPVLVKIIRNGNIEALKLLLNAGASFKIPTRRGYLPLHLAARSMNKNSTEMVKLLIEAGADPNSKETESTRGATGRTPLHAAVGYNSKINTIQLLLDAGADPNMPKNDGKTPLQIARENNLTEAVQLLINAGATE